MTALVFLQVQNNLHPGTGHPNRESCILERSSRGQNVSDITESYRKASRKRTLALEYSLPCSRAASGWCCHEKTSKISETSENKSLFLALAIMFPLKRTSMFNHQLQSERAVTRGHGDSRNRVGSMAMTQWSTHSIRSFLTLHCPQFHETNALPPTPLQQPWWAHFPRAHRIHCATVRLKADKIILILNF